MESKDLDEVSSFENELQAYEFLRKKTKGGLFNAIQRLAQAVEQNPNNYKSCLRLYEIYSSKAKKLQNPEKANFYLSLYLRNDKDGNRHYHLAELFRWNLKNKYDPQQSVAYYLKALALGDHAAAYRIYLLLGDKRIALQEINLSPEQIEDCFIILPHKINPLWHYAIISSQYLIALCYDEKIFGYSSPEKALYWYEKAANEGLVEAILIVLFRKYQCDLNLEAVDNLLSKIPKSARICYEIYSYLIGEKQFIRKYSYLQNDYNSIGVIEWLKKAADLGYTYAQWLLSQYYEAQPEKYELVIHYLETAAKQADINAQIKLYYYYKKGMFTKINEEKAHFWLKNLLSQHYYGLSTWYKILGYKFLAGKYVPKDDNEAHYWLNKIG